MLWQGKARSAPWALHRFALASRSDKWKKAKNRWSHVSALPWRWQQQQQRRPTLAATCLFNQWHHQSKETPGNADVTGSWPDSGTMCTAPPLVMLRSPALSPGWVQGKRILTSSSRSNLKLFNYFLSSDAQLRDCKGDSNSHHLFMYLSNLLAAHLAVQVTEQFPVHV